jgi:hypothetical protein
MADDEGQVRSRCRHCGRVLQPCPFCGNIGRDIVAQPPTDRINIGERNTAVLERIYRRYPALLISLGIVVAVPFIILLLHLNELIGFYVAEASGIAAFIIGLDTTIKVKRILESR